MGGAIYECKNLAQACTLRILTGKQIHTPGSTNSRGFEVNQECKECKSKRTKKLLESKKWCNNIIKQNLR